MGSLQAGLIIPGPLAPGMQGTDGGEPELLSSACPSPCLVLGLTQSHPRQSRTGCVGLREKTRSRGNDFQSRRTLASVSLLSLVSHHMWGRLTQETKWSE